MNSQISFKYNPGILGDDELISSFVVRQGHLSLILESLKENITSSGSVQHLIMVGPRGIGKTMLVRRVAAEVLRDEEFRKHWIPIVYGEESYQVTSAGDFWLEALNHLADSSPALSLDDTLAELRDERNDARLRERALAQLVDFADGQGKRLLLVIENLDMLCEQMSSEAQWELRHTLQNERRIMLLATAPSRFYAITASDQAWFDLFLVQDLKPLDPNETQTLWQAIARQKLKAGQARAIRILTGGNPRLLAILASFAARRSFRGLMEQLVHLIDEHTAYFKSHLEALSVGERKVFVTLLEQWNPVGSADVARAARMNVNEVSSLLSRLVGKGAVEIVDSRPRRNLYQASERLYNIYYLMRRRGQPSDRVRAVVSFMVTFYGGAKLAVTIADLAREACQLSAAESTDHFLAFEELARHAPQRILAQALEEAPPEFFRRGDAPEFVRDLERKRYEAAVKRVKASIESKVWPNVEKVCREELKRFEQSGPIWSCLGLALNIQGRLMEAAEALQKATAHDPMDATSWSSLATVFDQLKMPVEAEASYRKAIEVDPGRRDSWSGLARLLLKVDRPKESEAAYQKAVEIEPGNPRAWSGLGMALLDLGRFTDAEIAYQKAIEIEPKDCLSWCMLGRTLQRLHRRGDSENAYRTAISLDPKFPCSWHYLGSLLAASKLFKEAEEACREAINADPTHVDAWNELGITLARSARLEEAEKVFRHAIDLNPHSATALGNLGRALKQQGRTAEALQEYKRAVQLRSADSRIWSAFGHLVSEVGSPADAETVWRQALELHLNLSGCAVHLLEARRQLGARPDDLLGQAEEWIDRAARSAQSLDSMARFVLRSGYVTGFARAEAWAKEAAMKDPVPGVVETLALVQGALGKWTEALRTIVPLLDADMARESRRAVTDLVIQAAAAGHASEALEVVLGSHGANVLEPLVAGLQIYMKEKPNIAKEIFEVGKDVAGRINEVAKQKRTVGNPK